jgi:hypothetical protein
MENIIFAAIILSASIYTGVKIFNKIRQFIQMSKGGKENKACCGCDSCPTAGSCGRIHDL